MTKLFAFPASPALHADFVALSDAFSGARLPSAPQSALAVRLAQRYADEIIDALLVNLMKGADVESAAPKVLEAVVSVIKGTAHALIHQTLAKMPNAELRPVVDYIASRRTQLQVDGAYQDFISFVLSAQDYSLLQRVWSAVARGEGSREQMTQSMLRFAELAIQAFYDDSTATMKRGFIARNMFSVGHAAISKGSHAAITRLVPVLRERELRDFAAYFESMLKAV